MKQCISADTEVVYTFSRQFYDEYFELLSRVLGRLHYEKLKLNSDYSNSEDEIILIMLEVSEIVELLDYCLNEFSRVLMLKMSKTFTSYYFQGTYLELSLSRKLSIDFIKQASNNTATILKLDTLSTTDVEVVLPPGFANGSPDVNHISDLRIKFIKYNASPLIHLSEVNRFIDSPLIVFEIFDANTKPLQFNISSRVNKTGMFQYKIPYKSMKNYDP